MKKLAEKLESAGKVAVFPGLLLVVLSAASQCGYLLAAAFVFLGPAYLIQAVADWLRTRAALAELWSRNRAMGASPSILTPPRTVGSVTLRDQDPDQDNGDDWLKLPVEWDFPSRSIH